MVVETLSQNEFDLGNFANEERDLYKEVKESAKKQANYINSVVNSLPQRIQAITKQKLTENPRLTQRIKSKYDKLGSVKPNFFPFFCAYKGYEKMSKKIDI